MQIKTLGTTVLGRISNPSSSSALWGMLHRRTTLTKTNVQTKYQIRHVLARMLSLLLASIWGSAMNLTAVLVFFKLFVNMKATESLRVIFQSQVFLLEVFKEDPCWAWEVQEKAWRLSYFFFINLSGWKCLQNRCVAEGIVMRAREVAWRLVTIQELWRPWKQTDDLTCVREGGGRELYRWMGWQGPGEVLSTAAFWVDVQHHFEWDYIRLEQKTHQ